MDPVPDPNLGSDSTRSELIKKNVNFFIFWKMINKVYILKKSKVNKSNFQFVEINNKVKSTFILHIVFQN